MDMEILRLSGTSSKLYELVAPLVMNPAVLRQNNNYPFKTGFNYVWYLAVGNDGNVDGFMPLKPLARGFCIDNYYSKGDDPGILEKMIEAVKGDFPGHNPDNGERNSVLAAIVHKRHTGVFVEAGFRVCCEMKKYDKMEFGG